MTPTLVHNIITNDATNCSAKHVSILWRKKMCLRKCKLCNNHVKSIVFLRVSPIYCRTMEVNNNTSTYIRILAKLMTNPCKIDARLFFFSKNIENDANVEPKLRSESITNTWTNYTNKNITKNDAKIKRPKVIGPEGPEESLGPECQKR